jgi:hypothetical protein
MKSAHLTLCGQAPSRQHAPSMRAHRPGNDIAQGRHLWPWCGAHVGSPVVDDAVEGLRRTAGRVARGFIGEMGATTCWG